MNSQLQFRSGERIGLFFGSFNPIHMGHLIVAQYMVSFTELDRVCFVVSPQNPFKTSSELAPATDRLRMVEMSIEDNPHLSVSDIELHMPRPSYTIDTLDLLSEQYPETSFSLILGSDNLQEIEDWKEAQRLLASNDIYVYRRPGYTQGLDTNRNRVHVLDAPSLHISSTHIRSCLREGRSIRYLVPDVVIPYIETRQLYQNQGNL